MKLPPWKKQMDMLLLFILTKLNHLYCESVSNIWNYATLDQILNLAYPSKQPWELEGRGSQGSVHSDQRRPKLHWQSRASTMVLLLGKRPAAHYSRLPRHACPSSLQLWAQPRLASFSTSANILTVVKDPKILQVQTAPLKNIVMHHSMTGTN